jgi:hypothetical protein
LILFGHLQNTSLVVDEEIKEISLHTVDLLDVSLLFEGGESSTDDSLDNLVDSGGGLLEILLDGVKVVHDTLDGGVEEIGGLGGHHVSFIGEGIEIEGVGLGIDELIEFKVLGLVEFPILHI